MADDREIAGFAHPDDAIFGDRWGATPDTFGSRWVDTPSAFADRWGSMPARRAMRDNPDPAKTMRQMEANQRVSGVASHMAAGLLDYYKTPGDVLAGKYTPQPKDPNVLTEYDVEASNRGADQMVRRAMGMAGETLGVASPFARHGAMGAMGGKLVQPQGILRPQDIVASSVKYGDKVTNAHAHVFAYEQLQKELGLTDDAMGKLLDSGKLDFGFTTKDGAFLTRNDAMDRVGIDSHSQFDFRPDLISKSEPQGIRAYHVSPYDFDKFDISKVGTGQGAQSYGHGIYTAENPKVSGGPNSEYWREFSERFIKNNDAEGLATLALRNSNGDRGVAARLLTDDPKWRQNFPAQTPEAIRLLESNKPVGPRNYEVNINARPEQFLDWDKPLAQHSTDVQQAARPLIEQTKKSFPRLEDRADLTGELRGQDLYRAYSGHRSNPDFASAGFREAGIPGIKYLDQGSRFNQALYNDNPIANEARKFVEAAAGNSQKAGELFHKSNPVERWASPERDEIFRLIQQSGNRPTSNYVMFDDKLIDILRKYGIVGAPAAAMAEEMRKHMSEGEVPKEPQHFAGGGAAELPAFDPSKPFEEAPSSAPAFDPLKPFEPAPNADVGRGRAALEGALTGASAGWRDEVYGASKASGLPDFLGGYRAPVGAARLAYEHFTEPGTATAEYDRAVAEKRELQKRAKEQYPGTYLASEIGGALALPGSALMRAGTLPARMARSSAVGAGYGGLSGMGEGEGLPDSLAHGAAGTLTGAAVGAVAPPLVESALQVGSRLTTPLVGAVRGAFRPNDEAARRAVTAIDRDIAADPQAAARLTPQEFMAARQEGTPVSIMDMGADLTRGLADSAAITSPEGRTALNRVINDRFESQSPRIMGWLNQTFHYPNAQAQQEAIDNVARTVNRANYTRARNDPAAQAMWDEGFEQLMQAPVVQAAARDATRKGANVGAAQGFTPVQRPFEFHDTESLTPRYVQRVDNQGRTVLPNLDFWDNVKRGLDDKIGSLRRSGENSAARDAQQLRTALVNHLDELVPSYQQARAGAAHFFGAEDAMEAGQNFVTSRMGNREARAALARMNPTERQLFQDGYVSRFIERLGEAPDRRSILNQIGQSPAQRERLEIALGPQRARELEAMLRVEGIMDLARGAVQGNSRTAQRLFQLGLAGGAGLGAHGGYTMDPREMTYGAVLAALASGGRHIDQRVAQRVAQLLASDNPALLARGVNIVARSGRLLDAIRTTDRRIAASGAQQSANMLPAQLPGAGRAEDNQPPVPRPPSRQKNGGRVGQKQSFAA